MEQKDFIEAGMGNFIMKDNIYAIIDAESAPSKNIWKNAKENGKALDMTRGRKTHSFIVLKDGYVASSLLMPSTIIRRITHPNGHRKEVQMAKNLN